MPIMHITKERVESIERPLTGRVDYFDDVLRGFGIRVSALKAGSKPLTGAQEKTAGKTYFTLRRVNGKLTRTKIDTADKITAEKARKTAEAALADMGKGINPNEEKRQARQQIEDDKKQATTLEDALKDYLAKRKLKPSTVTLYKQLFTLHLADWLNKSASEITATMVNQRHTEIATGKRQRTKLKKEVNADAQTGKKAVKKVEPAQQIRREASADGVMRVLRAVLNYTFADDEEAGIVRVNPVRTLSRKKAWFKVDRRRTLIKNSELLTWYKAVNGLDNAIMRDYLLFLIFTGLRRQEAATLKWKQVDFEEGCFTIVDTKNKQPHVLPLSDYLHKMLKGRQDGLKLEFEAAQEALADAEKKSATLTKKQMQAARNRFALAESRLASSYVFPGEGATGYIVEPKRAIDAVTAVTGITFSCHDLRRTFATLAESLDLSSYTVKALLNHKQQIGDVTGGYIILNVDRLREPMQKITNALKERIRTQHGRVVRLQAKGE